MLAVKLLRAIIGPSASEIVDGLRQKINKIKEGEHKRISVLSIRHEIHQNATAISEICIGNLSIDRPELIEALERARQLIKSLEQYRNELPG